MPSPITALSGATARSIRGVFCDIDDTLTWEGVLRPEAFSALHDLHDAGLRVIPVTGRPAGWADLIARMWPVDGVVAENGGLWITRVPGGVRRGYVQSADERRRNRRSLDALAAEILAEVPGAGIASDQAFRELDLAVDWCEDVARLDDDAVDAIARAFTRRGATAKVSSIHVNGWFGDFDKLTGARRLVADRWGEDLESQREAWLYVGDSANDEPMFGWFPHTVGVANVADFLARMTHHPTWITPAPGGAGFAQAAAHLLSARTG